MSEIKVFYYNNGQLVDTAQMKYEIIDNDDIINEVKESAGKDDWAVEVYNNNGDVIYTANSQY